MLASKMARTCPRPVRGHEAFVSVLRTALALVVGLALFAAALLVGLRSSDRAHALTNCDTSEAGLNAAEQEFLRLINEERARVGVPPLKVSPSLNRAAAWMSADQASVGGLSHTDSTGREPAARMRDCGYPGGGTWGENVLAGATTAQGAFDLWRQSSGHYANMINPAFRVIGIGQHGSYWTTDFGSVDDSGQPGGPTPTNTPTPTPTATPTPTPTATSTPISTPTATSTPTSSATATPSPTSTSTATPTATAVPTRPADTIGPWRAWLPGLAADKN